MNNDKHADQKPRVQYARAKSCWRIRKRGSYNLLQKRCCSIVILKSLQFSREEQDLKTCVAAVLFEE